MGDSIADLGRPRFLGSEGTQPWVLSLAALTHRRREGLLTLPVMGLTEIIAFTRLEENRPSPTDSRGW
jgi:hypothetical protein